MGASGASAAPPASSRRPRLLAASYRAGARALRVMPAGVRHAVAGPGGVAWFWLSPAQRSAALDNYATALGRDRSDPDVARVARRAFQNYGRMLIDFLLLGSLTPVPGGPAAFALKTGAALLPACQYATAAGRYHVHLDAALAAHEGDTKETLMQRVIGRFEDFIKERPDQWYAFRPMFSR